MFPFPLGVGVSYLMTVLSSGLGEKLRLIWSGRESIHPIAPGILARLSHPLDPTGMRAVLLGTSVE